MSPWGLLLTLLLTVSMLGCAGYRRVCPDGVFGCLPMPQAISFCVEQDTVDLEMCARIHLAKDPRRLSPVERTVPSPLPIPKPETAQIDPTPPLDSEPAAPPATSKDSVAFQPEQ